MKAKELQIMAKVSGELLGTRTVATVHRSRGITELPAVPQPSEALPLVRRARNPRLRASITSAAAEDRAAGWGQALRTERQVGGLSFHSVSRKERRFDGSGVTSVRAMHALAHRMPAGRRFQGTQNALSIFLHIMLLQSTDSAQRGNWRLVEPNYSTNELWE